MLPITSAVGGEKGAGGRAPILEVTTAFPEKVHNKEWGNGDESERASDCLDLQMEGGVPKNADGRRPLLQFQFVMHRPLADHLRSIDRHLPLS